MSDQTQNKEKKLRCYCGKVVLVVKTDKPSSTGFCHCESCRRAHSAPVYSYFYVPKDDLIVEQGFEYLKPITMDPEKKDYFKRYFCSECGSRIFNWIKKTTGEFHGSFHSCFVNQEDCDDENFKPTKHIWCQNAILGLEQNMKDNLEKKPAENK